MALIEMMKRNVDLYPLQLLSWANGLYRPLFYKDEDIRKGVIAE